MTRQINIIASVFAALIVSAGLIGSAGAQDCPRGDLDKAYCDRDGDLVADAPTDPKQLVNPSTLIFAYTPVEDPAVYTKVWDGFIKHLEKVTGKKVVFFPVQSNAARNRGDALRPPAHRGLQHRLQSDRGELRRLRALRDHGRQGRRVRLRDGNHRAGRQRDQDAGRHQGQEARLHRADLEFRLQGAVRAAGVRIQPRGRSATTSRCSPASTTIRCSASPTRITTRPRSPTK